VTTPNAIAADLLAGFPGALRQAGLAIDPGRAMTFLRAVTVSRLERVEDLARTGRVTLTGSPDDFPVYDAVFEAWFGAAPGIPRPEIGEDEEQAPPNDRPRSGEAILEMAAAAAGKAAAHDLQRNRKAFGRLAQRDADALSRMARQVPALPRMLSRNWAASRGGRRVDLAGTMRAARRSFGEALRIMRRDRVERPRRLLFLVDVSGSMKAQSEATLRFAQLITARRRKVETFCFGTRLTRVTATLRRKDADEALDRLAGLVFDFDGGTMIGPSLAGFLSVSRHAALVRGAVTVVFSDGLERGDPAIMVGVVERLARLSHRLVWATPLAADPRYRPATRAMAGILPSLDAVVDSSDYDALENLLARLDAIERAPRREARRQFAETGT
jgi:uncharacterized protein with von Willebrand factor type A (vWA) domain